MEFFYPPANRNITYSPNVGFKFVDMKREVARFLLEELLPNAEEKRIERMVFQLGAILDDDRYQKIEREQLQQGLGKLLEEVAGEGNKTIEQISRDTGLNFDYSSVFDIIKEYQLNDLSSEKVVANLSKLPSSELEQYIRDIKLEQTITEKDGKEVKEIDFVNVDEGDTPYGTLELTDEQIRNKIFTNGFTYYYSDFDANKIVPYREEKYEHILSLGFSKVTQGGYRRSQFNPSNYTPFTKGKIKSIISELKNAGDDKKIMTEGEVKQRKKDISAAIKRLKETVKEEEENRESRLEEINELAEELFSKIKDISPKIESELRTKWSFEEIEEDQEDEEEKPKVDATEELTPMQSREVAELSSQYLQLEKDRSKIDKDLEKAKLKLANAEFKLENFETDGRYLPTIKLKAFVSLENKFDSKMNKIKDAGLRQIRSNEKLLKKIQNPLFSYFIELGRIDRVPMKRGNKKIISEAVNPNFFEPVESKDLKEKVVTINIGDRSSIIPTGGSGKPEKRIDIDTIDEGIQKELNSVISQTRKNFSSLKDLVTEQLEQGGGSEEYNLGRVAEYYSENERVD